MGEAIRNPVAGPQDQIPALGIRGELAQDVEIGRHDPTALPRADALQEDSGQVALVEPVKRKAHDHRRVVGGTRPERRLGVVPVEADASSVKSTPFIELTDGQGDSLRWEHDWPKASATSAVSWRHETRGAPLPSAPSPLRAVLYHHIASKVSSLVDRLAVSTAPNLFEAHVRKLARDYEIVSLDSVLSGRLPRRAMLLTFDDGYRSFVTSALPVLRRLGLPSVLFVTGACLDPYSVPLDNLLSYLCASVGLERLTAALDPQARGARSFLQLLDLVAAMPYARFVQLGDELADRFEVDQAALRAESGIFLNPQGLAGLSATGCEVANHTRTHLFCRSIPQRGGGTRGDSRPRPPTRVADRTTGTGLQLPVRPPGGRRSPMVERILRESGHSASFVGGVANTSEREHRPGLEQGAG